MKVRFLETKLRCELKCPRTAGAENAGSARGWSVDYILNYVWRFTLLCESDGRWESKVSYVEDIEDFADKIEFQPFVEAEGLSQANVLRDNRVAADLRTFRQRRESDDRVKESREGAIATSGWTVRAAIITQIGDGAVEK